MPGGYPFSVAVLDPAGDDAGFRHTIQLFDQSVQRNAVAGMRIIIQHQQVISLSALETGSVSTDTTILRKHDRRQKIRLRIQVGTGTVGRTVVDCNHLGIGAPRYQFPQICHGMACFL